MSQDAAVATADEAEVDFVYDIKIEDAGPAAKKVTVAIPESRIRAKLDEQFGEVADAAVIPGFRQGKAPRKLVERRFGSAIRDEVRNSLLRESYQQAVRTHELAVIGEPEFHDAEAIVIPDAGDLTYSFSVELQPTFDLPALAELVIKKPVIKVTDEHVQQALKNLREQQGTLVPADHRGIQANDRVVADISIEVEGETVGNQLDTNFVVKSGNIGGIEVTDLDTQLAGAKIDETRTVTATGPEQHPVEKLRGKTVSIKFTIKDIKELELAEIDQDFLDSLGFENEQQLLDELREQMVQRIDGDVKNAMHNQVRNYLVKNVNVELPSKLSQQQEARVVQRRAMELLQRGMPQEQIRSNLDAIRSGASAQAQNELKLFFALNKVAQEQGIEVDEAEVNGQIAQMAMMNDMRPDALKKELAERGQLSDLFLSLRERKTLDVLVGQAKVEEVEITAEQKAEDVHPDAKDPTETPSDAT